MLIEALVEAEAEPALGGRKRYQWDGKATGYRNGHQDWQLAGSFGALTVSLPLTRLVEADGGTLRTAQSPDPDQGRVQIELARRHDQ